MDKQHFDKAVAEHAPEARAGFADSFLASLIAASPQIAFPLVAKLVLSTLKNPESSKGRVLKPLAIAFAEAVCQRFPGEVNCASAED
jgi:hypothetical protein